MRDTLLTIYEQQMNKACYHDEIMNFIFENYQNITLRGLARHFGYSEPYLCKLFREEADTTFTKILRELS